MTMKISDPSLKKLLEIIEEAQAKIDMAKIEFSETSKNEANPFMGQETKYRTTIMKAESECAKKLA
jgi:hypothetical protein